MKISFDCDDVLAKFTKTLAIEYNRRFDTQYHADDFTPDPAQWGQLVGEAGVKRLWAMFLEPGYVLNVPPEEGAVEGVRMLSSYGIELIVTTSRINVAAGLTEQWLEQHFGNAFSKVTYATFDGGSDRLSKGEICRQESADFHVDDLTRHIVDVSCYGIHGLLMDQRWNQGLPNDSHITRVFGFKDVIEYVRRF